MTKLDDVKDRLSDYKKQYHPNFQYEISGWYSLFPVVQNKELEKQCVLWPGKFPKSNEKGIYLIFDNNKVLLYIGKASMNNSLGSRLSSYFSYEDDKVTCKVNHDWSSKPKYIVTIAVPKGMSFEAAAIEEYLIKEFADSLPDNKVGTNR